MDTDTFWDVIDTARAASGQDKPIEQALADSLAALGPQDILEYQQRFDDMHAALYRWDVWSAAYLIGGGCSDDGFIDFRAGIIAQGREWYEKVAMSPDSLAGHPAVASAAPGSWCGALFCELVNYAAASAYERVTGEENSFYEAGNDTETHPAIARAALRTWARTSTSTKPSRCAAAFPGSQPSTCPIRHLSTARSFCTRQQMPGELALGRRTAERSS